jgi:hypothetical protein
LINPGLCITDSTHSDHLFLLILIGQLYSRFTICHRGYTWGRSLCFYLQSYPVLIVRVGIYMFVFDHWLMSWHGCAPSKLWLMMYWENKISLWNSFWLEHWHGKLACPYCIENNKTSRWQTGVKHLFLTTTDVPYNKSYIQKKQKRFFCWQSWKGCYTLHAFWWRIAWRGVRIRWYYVWFSIQ